MTGKNGEELEIKTNEAFSDVVHCYESSGLRLNQNKTQIINFNNNQIKMKVGPKQDDFQKSVKHARMLGIQIVMFIFTRIEPPTVLSKIKILIKKVSEGSGVWGLRSFRLSFSYFLLVCFGSWAASGMFREQTKSTLIPLNK